MSNIYHTKKIKDSKESLYYVYLTCGIRDIDNELLYKWYDDWYISIITPVSIVPAKSIQDSMYVHMFWVFNQKTLVAERIKVPYTGPGHTGNIANYINNSINEKMKALGNPNRDICAVYKGTKY